jgi:mRNA-degrading endonuclease RelE of RelBE toxin-antitoxin system
VYEVVPPGTERLNRASKLPAHTREQVSHFSSSRSGKPIAVNVRAPRRQSRRTALGTSSRYSSSRVAKERRATTAYRIEAAPEVYEHLVRFSKRDQSLILDTLPRQLGYQPTVETRNRKRLVANLIAPWELRIERYRVYFEVQEEPDRVVRIVAIGLKIRENVLIGGVEVKLR